MLVEVSAVVLIGVEVAENHAGQAALEASKRVGAGVNPGRPPIYFRTSRCA
jgi:hypothetical protein